MTWGDLPIGNAHSELAGGPSLRNLRNAAGLTLQELAGRLNDHDVRIDAAHLQRIETGEIACPVAQTLDAILTKGLDAPFRYRQEILAAYGYRLPWTLPTASEVEEARRLSRHELMSSTWPAYFMDFGQRIWNWNRYMPRLLGVGPDDPLMMRFMGVTTLDLAFNPDLGTGQRVANLSTFRPLMLKIQTAPHAHEPWFQELIGRARSWPGFETVWSNLSNDAAAVLEHEAHVPIEIGVPGVAVPLRFRLSLSHLSLDPRFQVVDWIPYGSATLRQCARWAESEGA